ncbi:MAG: hypothetical protein FJ267_07035, partial [Planctomycetes bacterium]|nr:hypothetical protein [Planctomycetota bacterium]
MRSIPPTAVGLALISTLGLFVVVSWGLKLHADESESEHQVAVMRYSGRVLSGKMTRNAGGWLLEQGAGRIQIPEEQVEVIARSLNEAYRMKRDSVEEPTLATHLSLARWCISYRLYDEAKTELRSCLKQNSENAEALRLMQQVDEATAPKKVVQTSANSAVRSPEGFILPEVESLGGLSKETAAVFTSRIQPLLLNKCGNTNCHGKASKNSFVLHPNRVGANGHRSLTERNLAAVVEQIDLQEPALSPLLSVTKGNHGRANSLFSGHGGSEQLKSLRAWVKSVAEEKRSEEERLDSRPSIASSKKTSGRAPREIDDDVVEDAKEIRSLSTSRSASSGRSDDSKTTDKTDRSRKSVSSASAKQVTG